MGVKRTSKFKSVTSAFDPKRTLQTGPSGSDLKQTYWVRRLFCLFTSCFGALFCQAIATALWIVVSSAAASRTFVLPRDPSRRILERRRWELPPLPVVHEGDQSSSPEEADAIRDLVVEILDSKATWIDRKNNEVPIELGNILIIAPYNAQVFELQDRIPGGRIGTVDKFQGQEAPVVIYSITTSSYLDAPHGMEFLYSPNRLNVATSRARAICVLVGRPRYLKQSVEHPDGCN